MPPSLVLRGDADTIVRSQPLEFEKKRKTSLNVCEFVSVPREPHGFFAEAPGWREKDMGLIEDFLTDEKPLPAANK